MTGTTLLQHILEESFRDGFDDQNKESLNL